MNRFSAFLLTLCLSATALYAQDTISATGDRIEVEAGKFAVLKLDKPSTIVPLDPPILEADRFFRHDDTTFLLTLGGGLNKADILFVGAADAGQPPPIKRFVIVLKGSPNPQPQPGPSPGPNPNPNPEPGPSPQPTPSGPKYVFIVEETDARASHPQMAVLLASDLNQRLIAAGHDVRWYDEDDTASNVKPYVDYMTQRGVSPPGYIIYDKTSKQFTGAYAVPKDNAKQSILESVGLAP